MKLQVELYPGINKNMFKIVLNHEFFPKDILNESFIVIKTEKDHKQRLFISKVVQEEVFLHHRFLYKYSQFMWGLDK